MWMIRSVGLPFGGIFYVTFDLPHGHCCRLGVLSNSYSAIKYVLVNVIAVDSVDRQHLTTSTPEIGITSLLRTEY